MNTTYKYWVYHVDQLGRQLYQAPHRTRQGALDDYQDAKNDLANGQLSPNVVEICVYRGIDLEMIASTAQCSECHRTDGDHDPGCLAIE